MQGEELQTQFFISVGTNPLINLILQGLFWVLLLLMIPKSKFNSTNYKFKIFLFYLFISSHILFMLKHDIMKQIYMNLILQVYGLIF